EQLEHRRAQQREAYRLRNEEQIYDTTTVRCHQLGSMDLKCSHCYVLHWIEEKVAGSVTNPVFSTCCANRKVQLPIINQPPEPLLSLLTEEDSRSRNF
ncbi:25126_t:CDS:2, partial [Gigaspora margarita]